MGKKCDYKWVDLSGLPRQKGFGTRIDWKNSAGYNIPFRCDRVSGEINIVDVMECDKGKRYITITIDKYVPEPIKIRTDYLTNGNISDLVHNKIINVCPDLVKYLDNPNDAYVYSYCSTKPISMHCPMCGYKKQFDAAHLSTQGFGCPICGDGVKYPNKFISELLNQLNVDYVREATRTHKDLFWAEGFRYDFYIQLNTQKILIEADGGFHKYDDQKNRDIQKDMLAMQYGFKLIRIDCDYKTEDRFAYIKEHVIQSELRNILDLSNVDWDQCNKSALSSVVYEACLLWNEGKSTREISNLLGVCIQTVAKYLKRGVDIGLCPSYNAYESKQRAVYKPILCLDQQGLHYVFKGVNELVEMSVVYFEKQFSKGRVRNACQSRQSSYYGVAMKYITKEEYEQYKMINDNEVVLKEAI